MTPGSSIVQVGAEPEGALPVSVSYAPRRAELGQGLREFRPPQPGWIVKEIVLDPRNRVLAAAYGDRPMAMAEPKEPEERQGSTRSPSADRPHIQLMTKRSDGSPSATPGEVFGVAGRNFPDGSVVVLVLDGKPLPEPRRVGQTGAFQAAVRAPKEHGLHRLGNPFAGTGPRARRIDVPGEACRRFRARTAPADQVARKASSWMKAPVPANPPRPSRRASRRAPAVLPRSKRNRA